MRSWDTANQNRICRQQRALSLWHFSNRRVPGARAFSCSSTQGCSPSDLQWQNRTVVVSFNACSWTAWKIIINVVADPRRELATKRFEKHPFCCGDSARRTHLCWRRSPTKACPKGSFDSRTFHGRGNKQERGCGPWSHRTNPEWGAREKTHTHFLWNGGRAFLHKHLFHLRELLFCPWRQIFSPLIDLYCVFLRLFYFFWETKVDSTAGLGRTVVFPRRPSPLGLAIRRPWRVRPAVKFRGDSGRQLSLHLQLSVLLIWWNVVVCGNLVNVSIETETLERTWEAT